MSFPRGLSTVCHMRAKSGTLLGLELERKASDPKVPILIVPPEGPSKSGLVWGANPKSFMLELDEELAGFETVTACMAYEWLFDEQTRMDSLVGSLSSGMERLEESALFGSTGGFTNILSRNERQVVCGLYSSRHRLPDYPVHCTITLTDASGKRSQSHYSLYLKEYDPRSGSWFGQIVLPLVELDGVKAISFEHRPFQATDAYLLPMQQLRSLLEPSPLVELEAVRYPGNPRRYHLYVHRAPPYDEIIKRDLVWLVEIRN